MTSSRLRIATDGAQVVHESNWVAVWEASAPGTTSTIFASRSATNGDSWQAPQELYLVSEESGKRYPANDRPPARKPDVAGSFLGGVFVAVWEAATTTGLIAEGDNSDIGVAVFNSRTDDFSRFEFSGLPLTADMLAEDETSSDYAPSIATNDSGAWMVAWRSVEVDTESTASLEERTSVRLKASVSTDQGVTWGDSLIIANRVHAGAEPVVRSNGTGQWLVLWSDLNPDKDIVGDVDEKGKETTGTLDIYSSVSTNNGRTWSPKASIHNDLAESSADIKPRLTFTPDRGWVAVWTRVENPGVQHILSSSAANPANWIDGAPVATGVDANAQGDVSLATDGRAATLVTWGERLGTRLINYSVSLDFGASWGTPEVLANSRPNLSQPAIASDRNGKWVTVFKPGVIGAPHYTTTFIPIPGQVVADVNIKQDIAIFQAPSEPQHPVYTELPMDLTVTIENRGPDPATDSGVWMWAFKGDFEVIGIPAAPGKQTIYAVDEVENGTIERFKLTMAVGESIAPGESLPVTFNIIPKVAGARPMLFTTFSTYDPYLLDNYLAFNLPVFERPPLADLSTTLRSYPDAGSIGNGGFIGSPMALIVEVTNRGESDAQAVLLDEILEELIDGPGGAKVTAFTFNYAAATQGSWRYERMDDGRGRIFCHFGTIPIDGKATLVIAITPTQIGTFGHSALARSIDLKSLDMTPEDAHASGLFKVTNKREADISVTLSTSSANPQLGVPVTLTATLTNNGDGQNSNGGTAFHPRLILDVPQGAEIQAVRLQGGSFSRSATGPVICGLRALRAGGTATLAVDVVMRQPMNASFTAHASNEGAVDPNLANNTVTVPVQSGTAQLLPTESGGAVTSGAPASSPQFLYYDAGTDRSDKKVRKSKGKSRTSREKKARQQIEANRL